MENQSPNIEKLAEALSKVQADLKPAPKNAENPFFKKNYADLTTVWETCRKLLTDNGFAVTQTMEDSEKGPKLRTTLLHTSGQWVSGVLPIIATKQDAQSMGSAITYCRRYSLSAIVGIAPEGDDDDGETAQGRKNEKPPVQTAKASVPLGKAPEPAKAPESVFTKLSKQIEAAKSLGDVNAFKYELSRQVKAKAVTDDQATFLGEAYNSKLSELKPK